MTVYLHTKATTGAPWGDATTRAPFVSESEALSQAAADMRNGYETDSIRDEDGTIRIPEEELVNRIQQDEMARKVWEDLAPADG